MLFRKVYPMLLAKAERKGQTREEADAVTSWLTGYEKEDLARLLGTDITYGEFFQNAPMMNPKRTLVTGSICGVKLQEIEDPSMRDLRILDKLFDEPAKGKALEKILRS